MHLELAGPIALMAGLAGRVGVFDRRAVHQMLAAAARRDGGPEIVEHVSMEAEPLSGLEPDRPYADLVGFRDQLAPDASIGALGLARKLLPERGRPFAPVDPRRRLVGHRQGHRIPP